MFSDLRSLKEFIFRELFLRKLLEDVSTKMREYIKKEFQIQEQGPPFKAATRRIHRMILK